MPRAPRPIRIYLGKYQSLSLPFYWMPGPDLEVSKLHGTGVYRQLSSQDESLPSGLHCVVAYMRPSGEE